MIAPITTYVRFATFVSDNGFDENRACDLLRRTVAIVLSKRKKTLEFRSVLCILNANSTLNNLGIYVPLFLSQKAWMVPEKDATFDNTVSGGLECTKL